MTPRQLIAEKRCTAGCLTATSTTTGRCGCAYCGGKLHGLLADADVIALTDGRLAGLHRLSDAEVVSNAA